MSKPAAAPQELAQLVAAGDHRGLAQAMTLASSTREGDRAAVEQVVGSAAKSVMRAWRVGVVGPPGAGKSTLIEALGVELLSSDGSTIAVLSVDPSSAGRGGSLLGDTIRMPKLSIDPRAFVRATPSGVALDGLSVATDLQLDLCDVAGFDWVLVESVGIGQLDTGIADLVDVVVNVVPPAGGDAIQAMKLGLAERSDIFVVTKHDAELKASAEAAASALTWRASDADDRGVKLVVTSAASGEGIGELAEAVRTHRLACEADGRVASRRSRRAAAALWREVAQLSVTRARTSSRAAEIEKRVVEGELSARRGAAMLVDDAQLDAAD